MKKFATFADSLKPNTEVREDTFSNFKKRMKIAVKANAVYRRNAIQSASKWMLT